VRTKDTKLAGQLASALQSFQQQKLPLPGIRSSACRDALIEQIIESIHRIKYIELMRKRDISPLRPNPTSDLFDPLKAAVFHQRQGNLDEAFWLVFLSVHFGKNRRTGWRLARDVYGALGTAPVWDWARASASPQTFRRWLAANRATLQGGDGVARHFGNHRKYQSLDAYSASGTGAAVETYVRWVGAPRTHSQLIRDAQNAVGTDLRKVFDYLYKSMRAVASFGRTAKFDYLTMIGKLDLAPIEPGSTYMVGATGPLTGARLLFGQPKAGAADLDSKLVQLDAYLKLRFGMQVLEDGLCNWQKSPAKFVPFRG
jgi:Alpha-glutamyl/putrescinyl thymine pyrophosphorylase clade 3